MKRFAVLLLILNTAYALPAQEKQDTEKQNPFRFEVSYVGDAVHNISGGIKKGSAYLGMANLKIDFSTEKAGFWKGGTLYVNAANTHGGQPSATLIGDYQIASNIEAGELTYLHELWFRQHIGKASVIIGLQDLCAEFLSSEYAALFLNSSCGVHSTVATNLSVPVFPLTAMGLQFHYNLTDHLDFKVALFDGIPDDFSVNPHNLKWRLSKNDGYLSFSEIAFASPSQRRPGNYKMGAYYHNRHVTTLPGEDGLPVTKNHPGNYGIYLVADQSIIKKQSGRELSSFIQASISPRHINPNWYFIGCGLNYKGLFTKRTEDISGIACAHSGIGNKTGNETTIELTYRAQLGSWFFVQPDFQYIINPAGTDTRLNNSMVGIVRFGFTF